MNEEDKLIQEQLSKMPASLRKAIETVPWKSTVKEIALSNGLSGEKPEILERETMLILYGFESPNSYITNLVRELAVGEEIAITIAESVGEKVFRTISEKAEKIDKPSATSLNPQPSNLPMVEKGEVVHDVPHIEQSTEESATAATPVPNIHYEKGLDPYREPLV